MGSETPSIFQCLNGNGDRLPFAVDEARVACYQSAHHGCFFETEDVLYILAGRGGRKHASAPAIPALGGHLGASLLGVG
ncbi:DUF6957 family protein [Pseudomonas alliivorans]|uniref:DUF6957 family protein n=1 Tax=Pseudomonas alliivorans TaxID=2810613 RepID=UPI003527528D